jgi:phosphohistidine phosphatase
MEVWLVRHATAVEREEFAGDDADRPLTPRGRKKFRRFLREVLEQGGAPKLIITSPLLRAAETAEILRKAAKLKKPELLVNEALSPGVEADSIIDLVRSQDADIVALVGHEPDFSACVSQLIGGGQIALGKGFIACLRFSGTPEIGAAELRWLYGPLA